MARFYGKLNVLFSYLTSAIVSRRLIGGFSAVVLTSILTLHVLFWPIPHLGYIAHPQTAMILSVEPESPAAQAELQTGDRIVRIYNHPWEAVLNHPNILTLIGPREQLIPITIERANTIHHLTVQQGIPGFAFQIAKIANILLAMLCWLTGYILGIVRRHERAGSSLVAAFWLGMGGVLGSYFFARYASYPLRLGLQWLLLTALAPLAIYIHIWFPVRPVSERHARLARIALVGSWLILNTGLMIGVVVWRPSLVGLVLYLSAILPIAVLIALICSGTILHRAYRSTNVAHIRRQIRLIVLACFFVAFSWLLLLVLPTFLYGKPLLADHWIDLLVGLVPLAYLIGGVALDLYRLDRLAIRLAVHIGTITVLTAIFATITTVFALNGMLAALWTASCFVLLYRPVQHIGLRLLPAHMHVARTYQALHIAATNLTTTLDASRLIEALCIGVRTTFGDPALAFYLGSIDGSNTLSLTVQQRLPSLPPKIAPGALTEQLCQLPLVAESRTLYTLLAQTPLLREDEQALRYPGVVLWCPIRHTQGHLLGILLLGMRGDLDPYRSEDVREIQRLLEAAALAFANSAEYMQRREAEATIRQLYEQLQQTQAATAAAIARELHDEILNVNLRLNVEALQRLLCQVQDSSIRTELELILEGQQAMSQTIRLICEDLHHTGMDDPLGLPALLRQLVSQIQANWFGQCHLMIEGTACTIAALIQREALGIVREAMTNAVKHASATEIAVTLRYPQTWDEPVRLVIHDNGQSGQLVVAKPGHLGVQGMYERARTVGGILQFYQEPDKGTTVLFSFPLERAETIVGALTA